VGQNLGAEREVGGDRGRFVDERPCLLFCSWHACFAKMGNDVSSIVMNAVRENSRDKDREEGWLVVNRETLEARIDDDLDAGELGVLMATELLRLVESAEKLDFRSIECISEVLEELNVHLSQRKSHLLNSASAALIRKECACAVCGAVQIGIAAANMIELHDCCHFMCFQCFGNHVLRNAPNPRCPFPFCECLIANSDITMVLNKEQMERFCEISLHEIASNLVRCPNCQHGIDFEVAEEEEGDRKHRVRCRCNASFCAACLASPYHEGVSCKEFRSSASCRFCAERIPIPDPGSVQCCSNKTCLEKLDGLCLVERDCGHLCNGVRNEESCPNVCSDCFPNENCVVCLENLSNDAIIQLKCNHTMHASCIRQRMQIGNDSNRLGEISASHCLCPLCSALLSHPALEVEVNAGRELRKQRLDVIDRAKGDMNMPDRPEDDFLVMRCAECSNLFCGGLRACGEDDSTRKSICTSCLCVSQQIPLCPDHGADSMVFKCRFCCSPAQYFCWGTTHFCNKCHHRQMEGESLQLKEPSEFLQCDRVETCPLKLAHPPNGDQTSLPFVLGCAICKFSKQ